MSSIEFKEQLEIENLEDATSRKLGPGCSERELLAAWSTDRNAFICSDCGEILDVFTSLTSDMIFLHCPNCCYIFPVEEGDDECDEVDDPREHLCTYDAQGECSVCGNIRFNSSLTDELSGV